MQYLAKIEAGKVAELRASAARAAAGYSLVSWTGDVPEQYLGPLAHVINAFEDAPRGENVEPETWDAARLRERTGAHVRAGLLRDHSVAALHDATGEMAAYTGVIVDPEAPSWGFQELTAVTRPHRGHRLGLLVKTAMLELLAEAEPQLEFDHDQQRGRQRPHDRGQRAARLRGGRAGLAVLRRRRSRTCSVSRRSQS